jgi:hypothetical protein
MSLSLSCHWIFFYFSFLASHWWAATRRGIVGMLRISDSFSRPYQWTLVITLSLSPAARLLIWWWWWRLFNISFLSLSPGSEPFENDTQNKDIFCPSSFEIVFFCFFVFFWAVSVIFSGGIQSVRGG